MPILNIYASEDHLVPPSSSICLEQFVSTKDIETFKFQGGHLGVFVGSRSQKELAPKVYNFYLKREDWFKSNWTCVLWY